MIIFGWGHQTIKNYGATFKQKCPNCNNEGYWQLLKSTIWFTLFFIPVIPYSQKYMLLCPVCEKGIKVDFDKIYELKNLAEANTELINKRITVEEYNQRLGRVNDVTDKDESKYIEGSKDNGKDKISVNGFCSNCGNKINNEHNFCQNCGEKIN